MPKAFIGLGSNLGDRPAALRQALRLLAPEARVLRASSFYETPPWGYTDQPAFLNMAIEAETALPPLEMLAKLKAVEAQVGRQPSFRNGPRLIDLDILFYDDVAFDAETLSIPHPRLAERAFALLPLREIAPGLRHPLLKQSIAKLCDAVDAAGITITAPPPAPELLWGERTYVMAILNLTPDSFSGDGLLAQADPAAAALAQAEAAVRDGADFLDMGAESSRPGAEAVPAEEELRRLLPAIRAIKASRLFAHISVDTWKAQVAEACLAEGAGWINDIWGLHADADLAGVIARHNAGAILMHNRSRSGALRDLGALGRSYAGAEYTDLIADVAADLQASLDAALQAGIRKEDILLDPGIGFGKTPAQNMALINELGRFKALGCPLLVGPSRKSFIGQVLGLPVEEREEGTAAAVALAIARGADVVRVHDVRVQARVARMADAITRQKLSG